MSESRPTPAVPLDDLTPRARIRDAAMRLFAERGYAGASIRDIAEAAGVSPGLVQHHFGSKDALREACDVYAVARFRATKEATSDPALLSDPAVIRSHYALTLPAIRYIARALAEGSPGANTLFDDLVAMTESLLERGAGGEFPHTEDRRALAAVMTAQQLGMMVLNQHLSRVLGVDVLTPAGHPRMARALFEIYSQPVIGNELLTAARAGFGALGAGNGTSDARTADDTHGTDGRADTE